MEWRGGGDDESDDGSSKDTVVSASSADICVGLDPASRKSATREPVMKRKTRQKGILMGAKAAKVRTGPHTTTTAP